MDNVKSSFIDFNIIDISSDDFQTGPEYHEREFMLTFYHFVLRWFQFFDGPHGQFIVSTDTSQANL